VIFPYPAPGTGCGKRFIALAASYRGGKAEMKGIQAVGAGLILAGVLMAASPAQAGSFAIILQAGKESHEGSARALHALMYAQELKDHGHEVVLIFDGAGTAWAEELTDPESESKLKGRYDTLREAGIIEIICDYCAGAFQVKGELSGREAPLVGEYEGHPSIAKWAGQGYQLLVL